MDGMGGERLGDAACPGGGGSCLPPERRGAQGFGRQRGGTMLALAFLRDGRLYTCHAGDSRVYLLLVCSDGVTDMPADEDILRLLKAADTPEQAAQAVLDAAMAAGGRDNATAVVLFIGGIIRRG